MSRTNKNLLNVLSVLCSIQGELPDIGTPCTIVRLAGCNLHCSYCDTPESISSLGGDLQTPEKVRDFILEEGLSEILITGGEPLLQAPGIQDLISLLPNHKIVIETNGTVEIPEPLLAFSNVCVVADYKTFRLPPALRQKTLDNIFLLGKYSGSVKYVLSQPFDAARDKKMLAELKIFRDLAPLQIIFSFTETLFVSSWMPWIISFARNSRADVRAQIQIHKLMGLA